MKKISYFTKALLQVTFFTTVLVIASCGYNPKPEDTKVVAEEYNEAKFDNNAQEGDAQFLVNAAEISMEQIEVGQLAQQKGTTTNVKELGKIMEDAHTKSLSDLTALAKRKMITIPTSLTDDARDAYKDLNDKTGDDFDEAYADMMVSTHEDAIETFEKATTERYDIDIKNWAIATLPDLRTHLNLSTDFQKKYVKN
ncbi:MAG: DUF4142 domain-containing protein [Bacteroidales bacterium]